MDTVLVLGDIRFGGMEVPEKIPFGGEQQLVVHQLIGGDRVVDAMGRSDMPLEWSGIFLGQTALDRARALDTQRILGQPLTLTWSELNYEVVIQSFVADFERPYQIPYKISCTVVADNSSPVTAAPQSSIDGLMGTDMDSAQSYGDAIGDGELSGLLGGLDTAIGGVSSFANASQNVINTVLAPIQACNARVSLLIASAANTTENVATLGGVLPNTLASQSVTRLAEQATSFTQLPNLYGLQSTLGRMNANLGSVAGSAQTRTVAGGSLFDMAADAYGDATAWTGIAKANQLNDPELAGVQTLQIPAIPDTAGGVLGE